MLKALKSLNKSVLILLVVVIFLPIFLIVLLAVLQSCSNRSSYDKYERDMITAAGKYLKSKDLISNLNENSELVTLDILVSNGYIKQPDKVLKDTNCEGYVTARKNGNVKQLDLKGNIQYNVYLKCDKYKTNTLISNVMEDLTTSESGLYEDGSYYVYKGDNVNNYIKFYGQLYRIMSVDSNEIVKLVKNGSQTMSKAWDNKYNIESKSSAGKTIYKDSLILKSLLDNYLNNKIINEEARKHIVSHDSCIGKRDKNDLSISYDLDCSEILSNQVISLINISDFARASLDPDCNLISDRSCRNYNYLSYSVNNSWTLNSVIDNSYEVYYLSSGLPRITKASERNPYNIVIYIDGNEFISSGTGSQNNPYIIE